MWPLRSSLLTQELASSRRIAGLENTVQELRTKLADSHNIASNGEIAKLKNTIQALQMQLTDSQNTVERTEDDLNKTINRLRSDLQTQEVASNQKVTDLKEIVQGLHTQLADIQSTAKQREEGLNGTIKSLHEELTLQNTKSSETISHLEGSIQRLCTEISDGFDTAKLADTSMAFGDEVKLEQKEVKLMEINTKYEVYSVALLGDRGGIVGGDNGIQRWLLTNGEEVGAPIDAGGSVWDIAVSRDGRWIVSGTFRLHKLSTDPTLGGSYVTVWDIKNHKEVITFKAHDNIANALDISPDATRIATGSDDETARVWSLSTGEQLYSLGHKQVVIAVKFSPCGSLWATGSLGLLPSNDHSVRIWNSDGYLVVHFPGIHVCSTVVWSNDSKQLYALSQGGDIHCLDVSSGRMLSKWSIHSNDEPKCISLASDGALIAACANSSVSFWDASTRQQVGSVICHSAPVDCMVISENYELVTAGSSKITLWDLLHTLPSAYIDEHQIKLKVERKEAETRVKKTIQILRTQDGRSNEHFENLGSAFRHLQHVIKQRDCKLDETIYSLHVNLRISNDTMTDLEKSVEALSTERANLQQTASDLSKLLLVYRQKYQCESLYAGGRVIDAAKVLLEIMRTATHDMKADDFDTDWLIGFTKNCIVSLEKIGEEASRSRNHKEALTAYAIALSLGPLSPNELLTKWADVLLCHASVDEALDGAKEFKVPRFIIYRTICDILEGYGRIVEAVRYFQMMQSEEKSDHNERARWVLDFQRRCISSLNNSAEIAIRSEKLDEAVQHFSTILSLDPNQVDTLAKRSKTRATMTLWEAALQDADEIIRLDPSSHLGYERRYMALRGTGRHTEAVAVFEVVLSKLKESPEGRVRELYPQYVDARPVIRRIVNATIAPIPRVLIDTESGRLCDKLQQAEAFEALPIFSELASSMTREIDYAWIEREAKKFYGYVMLSHRWEQGEPLLQVVQKHVTIYKLAAVGANIKLQTFCKLAHDLGFRWAWSDTCCIDRKDNVVLQESLVAMFTWYRDSSLTVIYLLGVASHSQEPDDLRESIWNSRVWTFQEYAAAKRVRFYTEDWKLYLGLTMQNHKDSPDIIREMEMPGVSTNQLAALEPGLSNVRQKLYLASTRETTLVEDIAYSLLGIFRASIPVIYGEGTRAVGRLLEHVLMGSSDLTILAWTGTANNYNSCLPENLTVYNTLVPLHIPHMETAELDRIVMELRSSLPDISLAVSLYERLRGLPPPDFASSRLRLPGIISSVTSIAYTTEPDGQAKLHKYRATTPMFGDFEIITASELDTTRNYCLVHPWIRPLLNQEFSRNGAGLNETTQALRLVARLRQRFGGLLFERVSRTEYKRVAADSLIMVQVRKELALDELIKGIDIIDAL